MKDILESVAVKLAKKTLYFLDKEDKERLNLLLKTHKEQLTSLELRHHLIIEEFSYAQSFEDEKLIADSVAKSLKVSFCDVYFLLSFAKYRHLIRREMHIKYLKQEGVTPRHPVIDQPIPTFVRGYLRFAAELESMLPAQVA